MIDYKQFSDLLFESTRPDDTLTSFTATSRDYAPLLTSVVIIIIVVVVVDDAVVVAVDVHVTR